MSLATLTSVAEEAASASTFSRRSGDRALVRGTGKVTWRTFNQALFDDAVRTNRPIFMFLTAPWSQRGAAMERTTFRDQAVAMWLNEEFLSVRINRDERPELDLRMQQATQGLSGVQGLPLTLVLTPQGRVFFAGTYFPIDDDAVSQRPGMQTVLHRVQGIWKKQNADAMRQALELDEALRKANEGEGTPRELKPEYLDRLFSAARALVETQGTQLDQPAASNLFPVPRALELLLDRAPNADSPDAQLALKALDSMLRGGIYDQLDGGFFRCTVDTRWKVPRFEKLLSLNAEMINVLLRAWEISSNERYRSALLETLHFWSGIADANGCFYGSIAAGTTDLDDGDYYTFTIGDFERLLRDDTDCAFASAFFDVRESGDFPTTAPDRNALFQALSLADAAKISGLTPEAAFRRLTLIRQTLLQERMRRPMPSIDKNIYVDANALMAVAHIRCGQSLNAPELTARGLTVVDALLSRAIVTSGPHTGAAHVIAPKEFANATFLLQDEAALLYACAHAYGVKKEPRYLDAANAILQRLKASFWDAKTGAYFDCAAGFPSEAPGLNWRTRIFQDTHEPSAPGLIALACCKLAVLAARADLQKHAEELTQKAAPYIQEMGPYAATLTQAIEQLKRQSAK